MTEEENDMTEEEKELLMKRFGITVEQKSVYTYKSYKYERLKDAVNYAKIEVGGRHVAGDTSS
jgi:hypothetical protein